MIRVLIVDDSVVYRKIVSQWIKEESNMEVAATAASGKIALAKVGTCQPDLVLLDINMPDMDGLETLTELQKLHPKLPVIMFSSLTRRGAQVTLEALSRGASDYLAKPTTNEQSNESSSTRDQLIDKINAITSKDKQKGSSSRFSIEKTERSVNEDRSVSFDIVAIGGSTGGPQALTEILGCWDAKFPIPVVIVQHMPAPFTSLLAQRLNDQCPLEVIEATEGAEIKAGRICVAPAEHHLEVRRRNGKVLAHLTKHPPVNSCRPSVDVTFSSIAEHFKHKTLAVILTGMGKDGSRACANLFDIGARVLAQDKQSSIVWGMPGHVVENGKASRVLPLTQIGGEIYRLAKLRRSLRTPLEGKFPRSA